MNNDIASSPPNNIDPLDVVTKIPPINKKILNNDINDIAIVFDLKNS